MPILLTPVTLIFQRPANPAPPAPNGKGDIPNPNAWQPYPVTMGVGAIQTPTSKGDITDPNSWS